MKMRNKGKVYPSPSLPTTNRDSLSVLKLLPAAIFALASLLSLEDKEVLAYLMTRSLKFANPPSILQEKKKNTKKSDTQTHPPLFDCECFACYRSYWLKWNSSPNHELIDQAIDAFEDHLNNGELSRKTRNKKRDKMGPRGTGKIAAESDIPPPDVELETNFVPSLPENTQESGAAASEKGEEEVDTVEKLASPESAVVVRGTPVDSHKGFARKVLPDVLGLFNSRLWRLWSPNV